MADSSPSSSQPGARATKSTCTTEKVEGLHRFEIRNYSLIKDLATFPVGGYDWSVLFYPSGCLLVPKGYTSVYLQLTTSGAMARATFVVRVLNPAPLGRSSSSKGHLGIGLYSNTTGTTGAKHGIKLMATSELEATYLDRDGDRLVIECTLSVIGEPRASATTRLGIPVPLPSDLPEHLGRLLESGELADVTFDVRGQRFAAHRMVLAMRSPVFKAELFGPMSESGCITIKDVEPAVFKVLLDVIYTDSFPAMDGLDEDANRELARHLLVAADRYGMDRLKAQCENILSTSLDAHTVASTLALADRHSFHQLKDACVEFIITLGLNNGSVVVASREDDRPDQQLTCFTFLRYFCKAVGGILKIH